MTKKEFKDAMLRGLGRCVSAVRQAPERYREIVLWACKKDFAYDAQIEGTRSWYTYTMVNAYPDKETFINTAAEALKKHRCNGSWDLLHLSELLMFFAQDGYDTARQAVEEKYQALLATMFDRKRRPNRKFYELSDLERLGLVLAVDRKSFLRLAEDFGRLYREKKYMYDGAFAWFFDSKGVQYRKTMERAALRNENIACFVQREFADISARKELWEQRKGNSAENLTGVRLSKWLASKADKETVERYAHVYRQQTLPKLRAKALEAFSWCPYPDDPQSIIEDTGSACEELQNAAWRALKTIRHSAVRAFALNNAANGIHTPENLSLLATNYVPEDGKLMGDLLQEMITQRDWDGIHTAGMDIYRMIRKGNGIPYPKHLLPLLYAYDPCSFCRESALVYMSGHRMLTKKLLEECLYDSSYDIRSFAAKKLKNNRKGAIAPGRN